ncbi:MAG: hypothetical protein K2Q22_06620 [Cytophagales bacterium]|nr:hypothetical protein [Cytophagales bacterium]
MKTTLLVIILSIFFYTPSCGQTKNENSDHQIRDMLTNFYDAHLHIWTDVPPQPNEVKRNKLYSLWQKYCTSKFINEAKEAYINSGVDVLTNDLVSIELNDNLKVEKQADKKNVYIVSFIAKESEIPSGPIKKQIILYVSVIKEGESYKINSVR